MGLDMFLYKVSKPDILKEGERYKSDSIRSIKNLHLLSKEQQICKTIKDNSINIICTEKVYSPELIGKLVKKEVTYISKTSSMYCGEKCELKFDLFNTNKEKIGEIILTEKDNDKVLIEKDFEYIAFMAEEIDYQRKGLNDKGWSLIPENCEYCDKKTVIRNMCSGGGLKKSFLEKFEKGKTVFLAWW